MEEKLPFYLAYPMAFPSDEEQFVSRDYAYLNSLYPEAAKRLIPFIDDECTKMEYDGSMMYDEYPDRLQLNMLCKRIYSKAVEEGEEPGSWLMDLIMVMVYHELCLRRMEHRRYRRKLYVTIHGPGDRL